MSKEVNGRSFGWRADTPDQRDRKFGKVGFFKAIQLPKLIDLRDKCPPVYNQYTSSSCTAQGVGASHQFIQMKQNIPDMFMPSRLFLYFGAREIEGTINQDCGAMIRDVIKVAVRQGVCDEKKWPFDITKFAIRPTDECYGSAKKHTVASYERLDNTQINQLKGCLAEGYPFVFGSMLYKSFMSDDVAKTGKVAMPKPDEEAVGGHAMVACGYSDAMGCFIVRNSWGDEFGDKGYCYIPYAYLTNINLSDDFWTIRLINDNDAVKLQSQEKKSWFGRFWESIFGK
jgi:C1A family cysteine protease